MVLLPGILRLTPLAALATILIVVGFKLTKPSLYKKVYSQGWDQFLPFIITVLAVVGTDLLTGVLVGLVCGVFFVHPHKSSRSNYGGKPGFGLSIPLHQGRQFSSTKTNSAGSCALCRMGRR